LPLFKSLLVSNVSVDLFPEFIDAKGCFFVNILVIVHQLDLV